MSIQKARLQGKRYLNPVPTTVGDFSTMLKVLPQFLFKDRSARSPSKPLGPFHTDPLLYQVPPPSGLRITWFGHSSSLIEIDGLRILIDPMWDERAAPTTWIGPQRFFAPTLPLSDLPPIDIILISHDHYDHLGAVTIRQLARLPRCAGTRWITPLGVGKILTTLGVAPSNWTEVNWTDCVEVAGPEGAISITALPARHFSGRSLFNRFETLWASFAIKGPRHRLYYGADSGEWPGFAQIAADHGPFDLTMLEIGAFHELWSDIHMGPDGAIRSFQAMGAHGLLMPIHWALFDLALHAWNQPIESICASAKKENIRLWSPTPGVPTDVMPDVEVCTGWWR
jgi:L-ascorbate metabolism protein UlaG (beta-lactamase superfamily)